MLGSWQDVLLYSGGHLQISTPVASCGMCVGVKTAASIEASSKLKRDACDEVTKEETAFILSGEGDVKNVRRLRKFGVVGSFYQNVLQILQRNHQNLPRHFVIGPVLQLPQRLVKSRERKERKEK